MGRIAYELGEHNAATSLGYFQIISRPQIRKSETPNFVDFAKKMVEQNPVEMTSETKLRIVSGSLPLTDPASAKNFMAVYHVRKSISELTI